MRVGALEHQGVTFLIHAHVLAAGCAQAAERNFSINRGSGNVKCYVPAQEEPRLSVFARC
jgi:hypothetical protein